MGSDERNAPFQRHLEPMGDFRRGMFGSSLRLDEMAARAP